jgi:hypothetical protein
MTEKLLDFGRRSQGADVAVFYYAGHGIAISGTNYLLPVDADIKSEMDAKLGAAINVDVTRRLTVLGFDIKASGKFDESTRAVIRRWQAARGYPSSGYLTRLQHKALIGEIIPGAATADASDEKAQRPARRAQRSGGSSYHRGPDAGAAFIGGIMGGMIGGAFRR